MQRKFKTNETLLVGGGEALPVTMDIYVSTVWEAKIEKQ